MSLSEAGNAQANAVPLIVPRYQSSPTGPLPDNTFGAVLLGTLFGFLLYGLNIHQLYRYIRRYPKDTTFIRALAASSMILSMAQVIFSAATCHYYLVQNFANFTALTQATWSVNLIPTLGGFITITSYMFFARRVSMIGFGYKIASGLAMLFATVKTGFSIALAIKGFLNKSMETYLHSTSIIGACFGSGLLANILLTGALIHVLRRGRANNNRPEGAVDFIMTYVVNTGLLSCILDALTLILALTIQETLYWAALTLITPRLYIGTFLGVLNSRPEKLCVTRGADTFGAEMFGMSVIARANRRAAAEQWNVPQPPGEDVHTIDIKVTTEVEGDIVGIQGTPGPDSECHKDDKCRSTMSIA